MVVGDIGGGGRHEQLALGETPNIAARLEGLAAPNTVVISPVTARLVRQTFELEDLGASALKGVAEPMAVWRVLGRRTLSRHNDEVTPNRTPFLVGRDEELGLLRRRWEQSKEGLGQAVVNRAYYAMFYAVLALLALRKQETSRHAGAISLFDREFVRPEVFSTDLSQWLHRAFQRRLAADYAVPSTIQREEAQQVFNEAKAFVTRVKDYLRQELAL